MTSATISRPCVIPSLPATKPGPALQVSGVLPEEQEHLAANIKKASMEWASQVAQTKQLDLAFATRLASCTRPSDAVALCSEWMNHRVDSAVAMQHRLLEMWLDAVTASTVRKIAARLDGETAPRNDGE